MGLFVVPILILPTLINAGISWFLARTLTRGNTARVVVFLGTSALLTFATRLPDFVYDLTQSSTHTYRIHQPLQLRESNTVGLVWSGESIPWREGYFSTSGLHGSGGSPRWGAPDIRGVDALQVLFSAGGANVLERPSADSSMPTVVIEQTSTETHIRVHVRILEGGKTLSEFHSVERIWFRDEISTLIGDGRHTLLFLIKFTPWNWLAQRFEPRHGVHDFFHEAILGSRAGPGSYPTATVEVAWSETEVPAFLRKTSVPTLDLQDNCTDPPPQARRVGTSSATMVDSGYHRQARWSIDDLLPASHAERAGVTHRPRAIGFICGADGYAIWITVNSVQQRFVLLDRDWRVIGSLDAGIDLRESQGVRRLWNFHQVKETLVVESWRASPTSSEREVISRATIQSPLLARDVGSRTYPPPVAITETAVTVSHCRFSDLEVAPTLTAYAVAASSGSAVAIDDAAQPVAVLLAGAEPDTTWRVRKTVDTRVAAIHANAGDVVLLGEGWNGTQVSTYSYRAGDRSCPSTHSLETFARRVFLHAPKPATAVTADGEVLLGTHLAPALRTDERITAERIKVRRPLSFATAEEQRHAIALGDFPLGRSGWGSHFSERPSGGDGRFDAVLFDPEDPARVFHRELSSRIAIGPRDAWARNLPTRWGAYWNGRFRTARPMLIWLHVDVSWVDGQVLLDGHRLFGVQATGRFADRHETAPDRPIRIPAGTHALEVEFRQMPRGAASVDVEVVELAYLPDPGAGDSERAALTGVAVETPAADPFRR